MSRFETLRVNINDFRSSWIFLINLTPLLIAHAQNCSSMILNAKTVSVSLVT